MFDIGFWELLVIAVVILLVMGPERLPEVAKQAAFWVRKARQGMYRLRNEMQGELEGTPFGDLEKAKQEISDLKNDIRQFGRDLADSAQETVGDTAQETVGDTAPETVGDTAPETVGDTRKETVSDADETQQQVDSARRPNTESDSGTGAGKDKQASE